MELQRYKEISKWFNETFPDEPLLKEKILDKITKTYLRYKIHNCTMESMKCDHCKKNIHSLNQFLDIFVCNDCYHKLVSKVYYPNALEA